MSPLTLELPQTLRYQLQMLAQREGVSLDQYVVYALARQVSSAYTLTEREDSAQQRADFTALLERLDSVSDAELQRALTERERAEPEANLSPEIVARMQARIAKERER